MAALLAGFGSRASAVDEAAHRVVRPFDHAVPAPVDLDEAISGRRGELLDALLRRQSSLRYADDPVRAELVFPLLQGALRRDSAEWGLDDSDALEAFVFVLRSEGSAPGVYRVTARECAFVAPVSAIGDIEDLVVQRELATAAGIVSVCGRLDHAGAHGYRLRVTRAAMAIYDFHLRAQSRDLAGTLFAGFIASAARNLLHSDGVTRHPLISATYGRPVPVG
ncbi:hypothetical protein GCM10009754_40370 [Amycolatopsis minnesotensis]|uniref:Uncharacterized protein n=2 Tax=Amycolatopsis minnesotensis TaxID=337894 RepID=A0ABP5CJN9_9PSEU